MKCLIDENLPHQLGQILRINSLHATRISEQPTDTELWNYAKENKLILLTKDTDFFDRLLLIGPPPKVIWIRLGNLRKQQLVDTLVQRWPDISRLIADHDMVQVHPSHNETMDFPEQ
jgi:predicted nuclease of predicted toxin-antitoxin system